MRLAKFGDQALHIELLYYTREVFRIGFLKSDLRMEILKRFREENINFPFPNYNLNLQNDAPTINRKQE